MKSRIDVIFVNSLSIKELVEKHNTGSAIIIAKRSKPKYNMLTGKLDLKQSINLKCLLTTEIITNPLKSYSLRDVSSNKYYKDYTPVTIIRESITPENLNDLKEYNIKNLSKHVSVFVVSKELNKE